MENKLFREKSLDRVASPESLTDYMKVTTPSVWLVLSAIILLLVGVCCWGIFGRLDTKVQALVMSTGGYVYAVVEDVDAERIETGDEVRISKRTYTVQGIDTEPVLLGKEEASYLLHLLGKKEDCWVVLVTLSETYVDENGGTGTDVLKEGSYEASIVVDSVSPLSFVTN